MSSNLISKPDYLSLYEAETNKAEGIDFGFDNNGMWFTGNATGGSGYSGGEGDGGGYPVRTNFDFDSNDICEVIFTINQNDNCSDHGICIFNSWEQPQWDWDVNTTRIAYQIGCGSPQIKGRTTYAQAPEGGEGDTLATGTYTVKFIYNPDSGTVIAFTIEGEDPNGEIVKTHILHETLPPGNYRIGFSADQDNFGTKSYFTKLKILKNGQDVTTKNVTFDFSPTTPGDFVPGYVGDGCLDDSKVDGKSITRTGYFEIVDVYGNRKIVETRDGAEVNDSVDPYNILPNVVMIVDKNPPATPLPTPTATVTPTPTAVVITPTPTHVAGVDFTIEWFQKSVGSFGPHPRIYSLGLFPAPNAISIEGGGSHIYWWVGGSYKVDAVISQTIGTWYHYAVVRNNGLLKIFQNGVQVGSSSSWANTISSASNTLYIGAEPGPTSLYHGNITNFRWTTNAIYTGNFTPPSSPLTALADTKLLLLATDSGGLLTDSGGSAKSVTNVGTATWSSDSPFAGGVGGSISLNGTSQYLTIPASSDWDL
jgi:hypothetical protein